MKRRASNPLRLGVLSVSVLSIAIPTLACSGVWQKSGLLAVPTEWVEVQLQGKQLVIDQPCEAANGALSIRDGGDTLLENLGQEVVTYTITSARRRGDVLTLEVEYDGEPQPAFLLRWSQRYQTELIFLEREGSPTPDVPQMFVPAEKAGRYTMIKQDCPPIE